MNSLVFVTEFNPWTQQFFFSLVLCTLSLVVTLNVLSQTWLDTKTPQALNWGTLFKFWFSFQLLPDSGAQSLWHTLLNALGLDSKCSVSRITWHNHTTSIWLGKQLFELLIMSDLPSYWWSEPWTLFLYPLFFAVSFASRINCH